MSYSPYIVYVTQKPNLTLPKIEIALTWITHAKSIFNLNYFHYIISKICQFDRKLGKYIKSNTSPLCKHRYQIIFTHHTSSDLSIIFTA